MSTVAAPPDSFLDRTTTEELWKMFHTVDGWLFDPKLKLTALQRDNCFSFRETLMREILRRACRDESR